MATNKKNITNEETNEFSEEINETGEVTKESELELKFKELEAKYNALLMAMTGNLNNQPVLPYADFRNTFPRRIMCTILHPVPLCT